MDGITRLSARGPYFCRMLVSISTRDWPSPAFLIRSRTSWGRNSILFTSSPMIDRYVSFESTSSFMSENWATERQRWTKTTRAIRTCDHGAGTGTSNVPVATHSPVMQPTVALRRPSPDRAFSPKLSPAISKVGWMHRLPHDDPTTRQSSRSTKGHSPGAMRATRGPVASSPARHFKRVMWPCAGLGLGCTYLRNADEKAQQRHTLQMSKGCDRQVFLT